MAPKRSLSSITSHVNPSSNTRAKTAHEVLSEESGPATENDSRTCPAGNSSGQDKTTTTDDAPSSAVPANAESKAPEPNPIVRPDVVHNNVESAVSSTMVPVQVVEPNEATSSQNVVVSNTSVDVSMAEVTAVLADKGYFHEGIIRRVQEILTWSDPTSNTFSIHRLPDNLVWEEVKNGVTSSSNLLHVRGSTSPCVVWIAGHVINTWFYDSQGRPVARPALVISPIMENALTIARHFLGTVPSTSTSTRTMEESLKQIRASTFCTSRIRGKPGAQPIKFHQVFDGTNPTDNHHYPITGLATRIDASQIVDGDLVLMEAFMSRYKEGGKLPTDNNKGKKPDTKRWRNVYELQRVTLLGKQDNPPSDDDVDEDD